MTNEESYYHNGYFVSTIPAEVKMLLWNEIYSTDWVKDDKENIYKEVPSWYKSNAEYNVVEDGSNRKDFERRSGLDFIKQAPQTLKDIGSLLLTSEDLKFFHIYYEKAELMYTDLWNGSEEIPYHYDTINGADTLILMYLTEQEVWNSEWGGQIYLQKSLDDAILFEERFDPLSGTMLVINNANPLIKHKVTALTNLQVNRYTCSFNYKWM